MDAFSCLNNACRYLIKHKKIQIVVEQVEYMLDRLGGSSMSIYHAPSNTYISTNKYQVTLRCDHNCLIECCLPETDFMTNMHCMIDDIAGIDSLSTDEDKQVGRIMFILWNIYKKTCLPPNMDDPLNGFIFNRIYRITRTM